MYNPDIQYNYEGIVVSDAECGNREGMAYYVMLMRAFDKDYYAEKKIYAVHVTAFQLQVERIDIEMIGYMKNLQRRMQDPLLFGDIIKWNGEDMNDTTKVIYKIARDKKVYQMRVNSDGAQLEIGGVVDPNSTTFWNNICSVNIPPNVFLLVEPNVWVKAWIRVNVTGDFFPKMSIEFSFVSFSSFSGGDQVRVSEAPWNRNGLEEKFSTLKLVQDPALDDDDIPVLPPAVRIRPQNEWNDYIKNQTGLFVGNRLVVSKQLIQYDFILPLQEPKEEVIRFGKKVTNPVAGEYVRFSAEWSTIHSGFLITDLTVEYEIRSHPMNELGNISVVVKPSQFYKGLFEDLKGNLGLIDDPDDCLAFLEQYPGYSENFKAKVEVRAVRSRENRSVRFRIVKRDQYNERMISYEKWLKESQFTLDRLTGTLIDMETVFCPQRPNIVFKLRSDATKKQRCCIGTSLQFDAVHRPGYMNEMHVETFKVIPGLSSIITTTRKYYAPNVDRKTNVFRVKLSKDLHYDQLCRSDALGLVDIGVSWADVKTTEFEAWVIASPVVNNVRRAFTKFEVISIQMSAPAGVSGPRNGADSSSITGSHHSKLSTISRRFVGPAFRDHIITLPKAAPGLSSGHHTSPDSSF